MLPGKLAGLYLGTNTVSNMRTRHTLLSLQMACQTSFVTFPQQILQISTCFLRNSSPARFIPLLEFLQQDCSGRAALRFRWFMAVRGGAEAGPGYISTALPALHHLKWNASLGLRNAAGPPNVGQRQPPAVGYPAAKATNENPNLRVGGERAEFRRTTEPLSTERSLRPPSAANLGAWGYPAVQKRRCLAPPAS